jgi:hypothetical protein
MRHALLSLAPVTLVLLGWTAGAAVAGETEETSIHGFVDASYFYDSSAKNGEFGADQVEVDVIHQASERSSLRADLEWVRDGDEYLAQVEQAFMSYSLPSGPVFSFGKFNAPIGFELLDPPDMYQYSHALVFDYGIPTNLVGASVSDDLGRGFDAVLHVSNGWDADAMTGGNVTWGGRLGYSKGGFAGGVSGLAGKEAPEGADAFRRSVVDVDLSYENDRWIFGGEFNVGRVTQLSGAGEVDRDWVGLLVMAHAKLNEWAGLTLRYGSFDDQDGWVFGTVNGNSQLRQAFTISPTFTLDENFGCLAELRIDKSDQNAFVDKDGGPTDSNTSVAFEVTYGW